MNPMIRDMIMRRDGARRGRQGMRRGDRNMGGYDRGEDDMLYYKSRNPELDNAMRGGDMARGGQGGRSGGGNRGGGRGGDRGQYGGEDGGYNIYGHNGLGGRRGMEQDSVYRNYYNPDGAGNEMDEMEQDGRRGVKGTGRYGIGGSRYYGRRGRGRGRDRGLPFSVEGEFEMEDSRGGDYGDYADYADYGDYGDYRDYGDMSMLKLNKKDMQEWKKRMINADGSRGEHFTMEQIMPIAEKLNIKFDEYSEKELLMVANMLYSDYCEALKNVAPQDKEAIIYTKLAKAWLEDEDAPEGSEKLGLYYHCIVMAEED